MVHFYNYCAILDSYSYNPIHKLLVRLPQAECKFDDLTQFQHWLVHVKVGRAWLSLL